MAPGPHGVWTSQHGGSFDELRAMLREEGPWLASRRRRVVGEVAPGLLESPDDNPDAAGRPTSRANRLYDDHSRAHILQRYRDQHFQRGEDALAGSQLEQLLAGDGQFGGFLPDSGEDESGTEDDRQGARDADRDMAAVVERLFDESVEERSQGRPHEAIRLLREVLDLDPAYELAAQELQVLQARGTPGALAGDGHRSRGQRGGVTTHELPGETDDSTDSEVHADSDVVEHLSLIRDVHNTSLEKWQAGDYIGAYRWMLATEQLAPKSERVASDIDRLLRERGRELGHMDGAGKRVYAQDDLRLDLRLVGDSERGLRRAQERSRQIRREMTRRRRLARPGRINVYNPSTSILRAELEELQDTIAKFQSVIDARSRDRATGKRHTLPPDVETRKRSRILDFAPRVTT